MVVTCRAAANQQFAAALPGTIQRELGVGANGQPLVLLQSTYLP